MTDERERHYAHLSDLAYTAENGTRHNAAFQSHFKRTGLDGRYRVDHDLTTKNHVTFHDTHTGRGVVAYRGTNMRNARDLLADAGIAFGTHRFSSRFREAERVARAAIHKYGIGNVHVTGHSLGGAQALHVTNKIKGLEAHAFNPGTGAPKSHAHLLYELARGTRLFGGKSNKSNTHVYTTGLDPISLFANRLNATTHLRRPKHVDVHGMRNFL